MASRKPFYKLSERQQYRLLAKELEEDMRELDEHLDDEEHISRNLSFLTNAQNYSNQTVQTNFCDPMHVDDCSQLNLEESVLKSNNHEKNNCAMQVKKKFEIDYDTFISNLSTDFEFNNETDSSSEYSNLDSDSLTDYYDDREDDNDLPIYTDEGNEKIFPLTEALKEWYLECGSIGRDCMSKLLKILRNFGHTELPKDARSLLNTPDKTIITSCPPGEYFHYGLKSALENVLCKEKLDKDILIDINVDGLPITKSTNRTLWPILGRLVKNPYISPFVIGIYHGNEKPRSANIYLKPFIEDFKKMNREGFIYRNQKYIVHLRCIICDTPARSFCTCTKQHNGYFGCGKCFEEGTFKQKMLYLNENAPLRTNENFRNRVQEQHHHGESPFEDLPIDMVKQFPLDYMHLVCLGVTKLLLTLWLKYTPKLSAVQMQKLSSAFTNLNKYIPLEFNRKTQSILELNRWKASTFRLFLLYAGPIIINCILDKKFILNFNSLSCAIRILCDVDDCKRNNLYASQLMLYFIKNFKILYGKQYTTYSVHNLIHLPQDSLNYGNLDSFSAFDFENFMQFLKKLLRKNEKPLQQLHCRLAEGLQPTCKRKKPDLPWPLLSKRINKTLPLNCSDSHEKLVFQNFTLTTRQPNNCCILHDHTVIRIHYIGKENGKTAIIGRRFLKARGIRNYPCDSSLLGIYQIEEPSNLEVIYADNIARKCCLFLSEETIYAVPLLHH